MITGDQVKAARQILGWTQADLASRTHLSEGTIVLFEAGKARQMARVIETIRAVLEKAGVEFTIEGPVRFKHRTEVAKGVLAPEVVAEIKRLKAALPVVVDKAPKTPPFEAPVIEAEQPDMISRAIVELADLLRRRIQELES